MINKILALIPIDKKNHFISAALLYYVVHLISLIFFDRIASKIIASLVVIGAALKKDVYNDLIMKKGKFELLDILASSLIVILDWSVNEI